MVIIPNTSLTAEFGFGIVNFDKRAQTLIVKACFHTLFKELGKKPKFFVK